MTTFTDDAYSASSTSGSDPASISMNALGIAAGDLLILTASERSGTTHADYVVTDSDGETWSKFFGYDNAIGDSGGRISAGGWWREGVAGDAINNVAVDNGTANGKFGTLRVVGNDGSFTWTFVEEASAGSGTSDWNNLNSGTTSTPPGSDNFVWGCGLGRTGTDLPTTTSLDGQTDGARETLAGNNGLGACSAFNATGQTGAESAQIASDGSGTEGICVVGIWSDTASGSTGTGALTLPAQTASGAGTRDISGTGAPSLPATTASGTGARAVTGTGAPALPAVQASGAGTRDVAGTGAPTLPAVTASGAGTRAVTGTGALDLPAMTLSGSGTGGSAVIGDSGVPEDDDDEVMRMVIREFRKIAA